MTTPNVPIRLEFEIEVPGTPAQVWDAIATARGLTAWFLPTDSDERQGGHLVTHMGPEDVAADITGWDPPRRFAYEEDWATMLGRPGADVTPLASEFLVEARSGGTCVVRVVSSAFGTGADWEQEFVDDMASNWLPFFQQLRLYLSHFPGQRAATFTARASIPGTAEEIRAAVVDHLGVAAIGDAVAVDGQTGVVEQLEPVLLVRLEAPTPGMVRVWTGGPADDVATEVVGYLFPAGGDIGRHEEAWTEWLTSLTTDATR